MAAVALLEEVTHKEQILNIKEMQRISFNSLLPPGPMRSRAETKSMIVTIDKELGRFKTLPELDFRAGYLTGKIHEKEANGYITERQAEQLRNILFSKYEAIRTLEEQMQESRK